MKISLFILIFVVFYSCSKQKSTANLFPPELKEYYGRQLILPKRTWYFKGEEISVETLYPLSIVIYYDLSDCLPCKSKEFSLWLPFLNEIRNDSMPINIIPICASCDDTFIYALYKSNDINIPCIWDNRKEFEKYNTLPNNPLYHTFLLDENNKILLMGTPLYNPKLWQNYKKIITKFTNKL